LRWRLSVTRRGEEVKSEFSKAIVSIVVALNMFFAAAVLYIFLKIGKEPTALIAAFFAFTTGELWMLASIRRQKMNTENDKPPG